MPHQNKKICPSVSEQMFVKASRLNASCFRFGRGRFQANLQHDCDRKGKNAVFKVAFCYSLIWQTNGFDLRLILDCIQNI